MATAPEGMPDSGQTSPVRINYLDGHRLNRALRAGIDRVAAERVHLNRINVFPVPDGDTGTNLAQTCSTIAHVLINQSIDHAGQLLIQVADAALDGARGNSGAILAQFFQGLADCLGESARIDAGELVAALATCDEYARSAMDAPKEGTVLTVISDFSRAMHASHGEGLTDIVSLLDTGLETARRSLAATRDGLEAMRRANVVDAGAAGFVDLLEGMADFLHRGSLRAVPEPGTDGPDVVASLGPIELETDVEFRYCTECMLTAENIDRRKLRETLSELGNSLVLAGTRSKLKVHIHTNHPDQAFEAAGRFGTVSGQKADDMRQQTRSLQAGGPRVAVVTDSAADLPDSAYESLGIHVVPLRVHIGERSYLDKLSLTAEEFYAEIQANPEPPQTSQPAPGDFRRLYEFLVSHFEHVVSISVTAKLSGTWQAAVAAAERVQGPGKITVIDTRNASLGQGLIAIRAAECARAGRTAEEVINAVEESLPRTLAFGLVPDLSHAVRGGRVSTTQKWLADLLRVAPIIKLTTDGRVGFAGAIFRRGDPVRGLYRHLARHIKPGRKYRLAVGHANQLSAAERVRDAIAEAFPSVEPMYVTEIGSALGVHTGPRMIEAAIQECPPE